MHPVIVAAPTSPLVDEEIHIVVERLNPNQKVTVHASLESEQSMKKKDVFESYVHYIADDTGTIDFTRHAAVGGLYTGIEPMGLFWSMIPSTRNERRHSRLTKKDVETPLVTFLFIYNNHISHAQMKDSKLLATKVIKRWYKHHTVEREPVRTGRLRGTVFVPPGKGPFPAIIDLFGTAGGLMEFRASLLASHGFLTFSLAFFGYEDLPDSAMDIELEYFEEAIDFLNAHPNAARGGIGMVGVSVGGSMALATATYVPGVKCTVVINGPLFAQYSTMTYKGRVWNGKLYDMNRMYVEDGAVVLKNCLNDHSMNRNSIGDSLIEFHKSPNEFLLLFSEDDNAVNNKLMKNLANKLLNEHPNCRCKIIEFPGAGHLLEPPYSPLPSVTHTKLLNVPQRWGGNPKQHADAQLNAWNSMLKFLHDCFHLESNL